MTCSLDALHRFASTLFERTGVPAEDASLAAGVLLAADLRGIDSHGVARLRGYYEMLAAGLINPRPRARVVRATATTATVDGDNGLGLVVAPRANELAMEVDDLVRTLRATPPVPGTDGPLIPGDPERAAEAVRRRDGIPLIEPVAADLVALAAETGVSIGR